MVRNVAVDVANSINFFQWMFDYKLPLDKVYVARITAGHGQAFEGFLQLSEFTYAAEHPGQSELFRSHEAAHEFWGHVVGWEGYRDQWLSESFAEYSALMFLETTMDKDKYFAQILKKDMETVLRVMARPDFSKHIGPISLGSRASTSWIPFGYYIQAYVKGPLVLHMLRIILRNKYGNENMFRTILSDFLNTFQGKNPNTQDFINIVQQKTQSDWSWFFKQWIDDTAIPHYRWDYIIAKNDSPGKGAYTCQLKVKKENVAEDFIMPIPVKFEWKDGTSSQFVIIVDELEETFEFALDQKPKKVIFNPDFAVLAEVSGL